MKIFFQLCFSPSVLSPSIHRIPTSKTYSSLFLKCNVS